MRTIFLVMDSLNRHFLPAFGGHDWVRTPNLDRLARQGVAFDNHWCGSLPCMPARREMMTGRLNFLEAPWGPIEPWDDCLPNELRRQSGVYSHLITDHYHYFHSGGEAYHTLFDSWEFERGQEGDVWHPLVQAPKPPDGVRGKGRTRRAYWANRAFLDPEDDLSYPTPRCFARAMEFLDHNHAADNWHLHLEVFDPHEPFDCPARYRDLYGDTWQGPLYNWPEYAPLDPELDNEDAVRHIRTRYAGALTMADAWLGKFLERMDRHGMWKDTVLVLTTDHGHLLGEHGYWAKNYMQVYHELARIPLVICAPRAAQSGGRVAALTATIDIMPTFMDLHRASLPPHVRGRSLVHLLEGGAEHHEAVLYGYFGKDVNITDGRFTYCRQPIPGAPLHHYTAMPRGFSDFIPRDRLAKAEAGVFLPTTYGIPHFRIPCASSRHLHAPERDPLYDLAHDPGQTAPLDAPEVAARLTELLRRQLAAADAPECQFRRLGLA